MPQSLVKMLVHVVFSTKDRVNLITPEIEDALFAYISGIVKGNNGRLIIGDGTPNHIHLLMSIGRIDVGELIGDVKRNSSLWIKSKAASSASFIGKEDMARFLSDNHKCRKFQGISATKKNIIKRKATRMNFGHCAESMMWIRRAILLGLIVRRLQRLIFRFS